MNGRTNIRFRPFITKTAKGQERMFAGSTRNTNSLESLIMMPIVFAPNTFRIANPLPPPLRHKGSQTEQTRNGKKLQIFFLIRTTPS